MTEVHRYHVVKMLSEGGNRISYDPHGPEVVMASAYDQLKTENERLAAACERAEQIIIVECKAASLAKARANLLEADRDQLRAEIAGLKTGYEAYEQVNAELKAEVEALRKDAELHAQIQRAAGELPVGWEVRVCVEHESGYVELWDQDGCEVDFPNSCESLALTVSDAIDAALGQGEQS